MKKPTDSFYYDEHSAITFLKNQPDFESTSIYHLCGGIGAGMRYFHIKWLSIGELSKIEDRLSEILSQISEHRDLMPIIRSDVRMGIERLLFETNKIAGIYLDENFENKCKSIDLEQRCKRLLAEVQKRKKELSHPYRS